MYDLTTLEGITRCLTESLLPVFKRTYDAAGAFGMAVASIVTRHGGKTLEKPGTIVVLSAGEPSVFLPRAYRRALVEYHSPGVITIGMTFMAHFETETEMEAWRGRSMADHPGYYEAMIATLEHKLFGVHFWEGRVVDQDGRKVIGPFVKSEDVERPDQGFLEYARTMS